MSPTTTWSSVASRGSDRVLKWLDRGHGVEDIRRASQEVKAGGFGLSVDLMLGFEIEEPADREATFGLAEELGRQDIRVNMHFLMPLPGTPLSNRPRKFLSGEERRRLDRLAQQGIVRGHWKRQERASRAWRDRETQNPSA